MCPREANEIIASIGVVAAAILALIERIVLPPGVVWGETGAKLVGDLGAILEWIGAGDRRALKYRRCPSDPVSLRLFHKVSDRDAVFA